MIANHKGEIPVVILLLPFLLGIIAGIGLFANAGTNWLIGICAFLSLTFIVLNLNYNKLRLYKYRWLGGSLITFVLFLFGSIITINYSELKLQDHFSKTAAQFLIIKITNEPVLKNGLLRFTANAEAGVNKGIQTQASGTLLITIKDTAAKNLQYGDELLIPAKYNPIDPPFNPAEFNYKKYLANKNIFYQEFLFPKQYRVLKADAGNPLIAYSLRLRQNLVEKLKRGMRDTDAVAIASTLILGYKADLSEDVLQAYKKTGTMYVLSVSGAQVAIIYLLLTYCLQFLTRYRYGKLLRAIIIIAVIWFYAMLTGFSLAVCRVDVVVSLVVIGKTFSRYINTLNILAVAAFALLLYDPLFITEAGFQLSFIAVSGLIVFEPVVYQWLNFKHKWAGKIWKICSVSIAAQVIIFPLSALYFHEFPVYFLISNLFVVIPAALIMYAGIFYLLLPQIPVVSTSIGFILEKTIILLNKGLADIENVPFATISKIWLTTPEYLLLYAIIISLFYFLYDKKVWQLQLCLACALLFCLSISIKSIKQSNAKEIAWLNLKKHTGIIFKNGDEGIVLTDLKASEKIFQYSIQPYLDSCQVSNISIYSPNQDINTAWLKKKSGLVQFLHTTLFVFDKGFFSDDLSEKVKTNYIYLTGNPDTGLKSINRSFDYHSLVIDGTNSDKKINLWAKQLTDEHINFTILKRNKSLVSVSN